MRLQQSRSSLTNSSRNSSGGCQKGHSREHSIQGRTINLKKLEQIKKDIVILHAGPINRGVEITSDVADSKNAVILDQVENGVAIRMAIIYLLVAKLNIPHV